MNYKGMVERKVHFVIKLHDFLIKYVVYICHQSPPPPKKKFFLATYLFTVKSLSHLSPNQQIFTANWLEGRTIKYTNFQAINMNSRSKHHWNIHVVLCQVSVTWNKCWGIGIPELHNHAERQSAFNTSSKWILLIFHFYDIFLVFFPLMWCLQVYWHQKPVPNSP